MSVATRKRSSLGTRQDEADATRPIHRQPPSRSWAIWLLTIAALVALLAASWWVTHSPVFRARHISVGGNSHLSDRQVLALAGINGKTNVIWFSPEKVEARLERDPWVQSASVSRNLPSTISVSVRERTPVAVAVSGERRSMVAADGTLLGLPARSASRLPTIEWPGLGARTGERATPRVLVALRAIVAAPAGLRGRMRRTSFGPDGGLVIELASGIRALYGDGTQPAEKGQALQAILLWATRHGVALQSVDVRAPVTPSARPVAPASPGPAITLSLVPARSPSGTRATPVPTSTPSPSPSP